MSPPSVHGVHHVTALAGDPQETLAFWAGVLGLRLVKRSVNQDDPGTYHLFFADAEGTPGTDVTFFPRSGMPPARPGVGKVAEIALAVPAGSLAWWRSRLEERGIGAAESVTRFGEETLALEDPHGLALSLVEVADERAFAPWEGSGVPAQRQVRGVHAVRIRVGDAEPTGRLLADTLGFRVAEERGGWTRWAAADGGAGFLDLEEAPGVPPGRWGAGGVHHVAWRVRDAAEEDALREAVVAAGLSPTPPIDRFWFRSVYFVEPGGTLFELATDGPGFDRDEEPGRLGERLVLPPWLESRRAEIESGLPPLEVPTA